MQIMMETSKTRILFLRAREAFKRATFHSYILTYILFMPNFLTAQKLSKDQTFSKDDNVDDQLLSCT